MRRTKKTSSGPTRQKFADTPRPRFPLRDMRQLEQLTLGRWMDFRIPKDIRDAMSRLAMFLSKQGGEQVLGRSATRSQKRALETALEVSYMRGFNLALFRYEKEVKMAAKVAAYEEARAENGRILAAEGREAKAVYDRERAKLIRNLYRRYRVEFPEGRSGNGMAHRRVVEQFEYITDRTITVRTVRETLKRSGIA